MLSTLVLTSTAMAAAEAVPAWCAAIPDVARKFVPECNAATLEAAEAVPAWCAAIPDVGRQFVPACNPGAASLELAHEGPRQQGGAVRKFKMEEDNNDAVRVEVKAVIREQDFEGMKRVHGGKGGKDGEEGQRFGKNVEKEADREAVRIEVKAVIRDQDFEGMKRVHRLSPEHHDDDGEEPPAAAEAAEAVPAWCAAIPDVARKFVPACNAASAAEAVEAVPAWCAAIPDVARKFVPACNAASLELAHEGPRQQGGAVRKFKMEEDNNDAVRVEVKAVIREQDFEGMKRVHGGKGGQRFGKNVEKEADREAVRVEVKAVIRDQDFEGMKRVHRPGQAPEQRGDDTEAPEADAPATEATAVRKFKMEEDNNEAVRVEVKAVVREQDFEGMKRVHGGEGPEGPRYGKNVAEMDGGMEAKVEVKAVVRDQDLQGVKRVQRRANPDAEGPNSESIQACAAYCNSTPRLSQQYDPNCSACPGAGTNPTGTPCTVTYCGWVPQTAWSLTPGCTGCH